MSIASSLLLLASEPMLLNDVSWEEYEQLLNDLDAQHLHRRVTYDRGRMEIMPPLPIHERGKKFIARLVEAYAMERGIWILALGSVTCRREDLARGLEPDECYYVTHRLRNQDELDLTVDPPPDLAVEVDITSSSIPRRPIYAALGVPEIWRFDGKRLAVLLRCDDGGYRPSAQSLAFPQLDMEKVNEFLGLGLGGDQHAAVMAFRAWLRDQ